MIHLLAGIAAAFTLTWCASNYVDFIARDPFDFDRGPFWFSKFITMLSLTAPFLLFPIGLHIEQSIIYNALLSLAVSALIVPAVFANRTGEGGTWLANMVEKSIGTSVLAFVVSFFTVHFQTVWWYGLLVILGAISIRSRRLLLLVNIQDLSKPDDWNDMRVRAMSSFIYRANIAYWLLAMGLGSLVHYSYVGVASWNTGLKQLWAQVLHA